MNSKLCPLDDELNCTHLYIERELLDLGKERECNVDVLVLTGEGRGEMKARGL